MATLDGNVDTHKASTGAEFELKWSKDETAVRLQVSHSGGYESHKTVHFTVAELNELRRFLNDRMNY